MGVGEDFKTFCDNLAISRRDVISSRCKAITQRLNKDYYGYDSDIYHSFYGGSFGRGTAINSTSDVDLLFELPSSVYHQYDNYSGNGQSALLQAVKNSIKQTYASSEVGADGQVVVVSFSDGIVFEVLPVFLNTSNSYTFPDSNDGGSWKTTNPKPEIKAIQDMDISCNENLKRLCKMMRSWKIQWNVPIRGLLIDTLAYNFISSWGSRDKSYLYYDWLSRDFLYYLNQRDANQSYWLAPGSNQYVWRSGNFEYKAGQCYNLALEAIQQAKDNKTWSSKQTWRKIYGTDYPE